MAKKRLILFIIISMIMLATALCVFFPCAKADYSQAAAIENKSGNNFVLTGYSGNPLKHFFYDENEASTLVNAYAKESDGQYYAIAAKSKGSSSGWSEICPSSDMTEFIKRGILYASASANVTTSKNSSVKIQISSGNSSQEISGTGQIATPLVKVSDLNANIRFTFSGTSSGKNGFVLQEPTIHIYTVIDSVTLDEKDMNVSPGQNIKINAYNDVTKIEGMTGNFLRFSKLNHAIQYHFIKGGNLVQVIGSNFIILDNAKENDVIKFYVSCKKNSYSNEEISSSNIVTLTVSQSLINVRVRTDFDSPATFQGEKLYEKDRKFALTVVPKPDFQFKGWYINGEFASNSRTIYDFATPGIDIYAKFVKSISIANIEVKSRQYDGTVVINNDDVSVHFNGVEGGHELGISGVTYSFGDANAGSGKLIIAKYNQLVLTGKDAELYTLKSQVVPNSYGEILKRDVYLSPKVTQKEYGNTDPVINYIVKNLIDGEALHGNLGREEGEMIGKYAINCGTVKEQNPNYNIILADESQYFEITPRKVSLSSVKVKEKIYDGTKNAEISANLTNVYNNEDVNVEIVSQFATKDVGANIEVSITSMKLVGKDKDNYVLENFNTKIYGNISPKPLTITAKACNFVYGEDFKFDYIASGVEKGDELNLTLAIDDKNVGQHQIKLQNFESPNYTVEKFESAICEISPRDVFVQADEQSKFYGDDDPEFTYQISNLISGDKLAGTLMRSQGEDVGSYKINVGTLKNANYNINFTESVLQILQRPIDAKITFLDKEYDGETSVNFQVVYENNIKNDDFDLSVDAQLKDKNSGKVSVEVKDKYIEGSNIKNYTFNYIFVNDSITIEKRTANVFMDSLTKTYGQDDPEINYSITNLIKDDSLNLTIFREEGENAGLYQYILSGEEERNYKVVLIDAYLEILPRKVRLLVENQSKVFGDADPIIAFQFIDQLCFGDSIDEVIDGQILRESGENVGVYEYDFSKVSSSGNYQFENSISSNFIITKRPVVVTCSLAKKYYGDDDPTFKYTVSNDIEGDRLDVQILREYGENVGEYKLICGTTNDSRYTIDFVESYLIIMPYSIVIRAEEKIKIYGEADPALTVTVTNGFLRNNDKTEDIISGSLVRDEGENIGSYQINLGTLTFGKNYSLVFESGNLTVLPRQITINPSENYKIYGEKDPVLKYEIGGQGLAFEDKLSGNLSRKDGDDVGFYEILKGNISLSENYEIEFVSAKFEIKARPIKIVPTILTKQFGEPEPEIAFDIDGSLIDGDSLSGRLYRENVTNENIGRYKIHSTLQNSNYQIIFDECYFTILPRQIVIKADDCEILYGAQEPKLTYRIISGSVLEGDKIEGTLSRTAGNSVGNYDIISTLSLGRNYDITFIKGVVKILPLKIVIESHDYQKIYGQEDPIFDYKIVEGELINNDTLFGFLTREAGEDVGSYSLVPSVYNSNYDISLKTAHLTIVQKDVNMLTSIHNKIYDGNTRAYLKNPYISGKIDDIYLSYDKENCAEFESSQVGKHIKVTVHDITLGGEKAANYNLILPDELYADITLQDLQNQAVQVWSQSPVLYEEYNLKSEFDYDEKRIIKNHKTMIKCNVWLENQNENVQSDDLFTITINLPQSVLNKNNVYVYIKSQDGQMKLVSSEKGDGEIIIKQSQLGEFYITVENETWIDYAAFASMIFIGAMFVLSLIILIKKRKNYKKTQKK